MARHRFPHPARVLRRLSLVTTSRRSAVRTETSAPSNRTASAVMRPGAAPCSSTVTSRSARVGRAVTARWRSSFSSTGAVFIGTSLRSRPERLLISETSADRRPQDFSASSRSLRCCSLSGPARSFKSIRMYPATTVIGVRNSCTACDNSLGQRASGAPLVITVHFGVLPRPVGRGAEGPVLLQSEDSGLGTRDGTRGSGTSAFAHGATAGQAGLGARLH